MKKSGKSGKMDYMGMMLGKGPAMPPVKKAKKKMGKKK